MEELIRLWKNYMRACKRVPAATEGSSRVCVGRSFLVVVEVEGKWTHTGSACMGHFFYTFGCVDTCLHRCAFNTFIEQLFSVE